LPHDWNEKFNNVWIGTSIGSEKGLKRMYDLMDAFNEWKNGGKELRKPITFISFEPLHERIDANFDISTIIWFDWIIIGGESGNETGKYRYRPCQIEWIEELAHSFGSCGVSVFIKQLGTYLSKQLKMSDRHGGDIDEFPEHLKIREFPRNLKLRSQKII
jgi:protein gp37